MDIIFSDKDANIQILKNLPPPLTNNVSLEVTMLEE